jgi:transposase
MIGANHVQVWVATSPVDMRKSFDTLAEVVRTFLGHDPLSGHMFVFRNRTAERVKILWWDRDGLAIYYKRLEKGTFQFPASAGKSMAISSAELVKLLSGCKIAGAAAAVDSSGGCGRK